MHSWAILYPSIYKTSGYGTGFASMIALLTAVIKNNMVITEYNFKFAAP